LLGSLLARHVQNIHFVRSVDLSWQELTENNVIFLGGTRTFGEVLRMLPAKTDLTLEAGGLRISSPKTGTSSFVPDGMIWDSGSGRSAIPDDGVVNTLIEMLPGPNGKGYVATFLSHLNTGVPAAVEYVTDPGLLRDLMTKLRDGSGHLPRYFQVALQVTFKGGVPINTRYTLHRDVHLDSGALGR
jgi:hypothetical protein